MKIIFALWMLLAVSANAAEITSNPVAQFLADYEIITGDVLLRLDVDINGDGQNDVLLSLSKSNAYKFGNLWIVYLGVQGGYVEAKGSGLNGEVLDHYPVSFRPDAYSVGDIAEVGKHGIMAFTPGSKTEGSLKAITVDGDKIRETDLGVISLIGSDKLKYDRLFGKAPSPRIRKFRIPKDH